MGLFDTPGLTKSKAGQLFRPSRVPCLSNVPPPFYTATSGANLSDGTSQGELCRTVHEVLHTCFGLWVTFSNMYNNTGTGSGSIELPGPNAITIFACIEINGHTAKVPLIPGGDTLQPGQSKTYFAPVEVALGDAVAIWSQVYVGTLGQQWPVGGPIMPRSTDKGQLTGTGSSDVTISTGYSSLTTLTLATRRFGPCAVSGNVADGVNPPSVLLCGTSICMGIGSTNNDFGYCVVPFRDNSSPPIPYLMIAQSSSTTTQLGAVNTRNLKMAALENIAFTHAIHEAWTNDLGFSASSVEQSGVNVWTMLARRGMKVYTVTSVPRTSDANGTTPGSNEATRLSINGWVRDGGPLNASTLAPVATGTVGALRFGQSGHPCLGYFDTADMMETSRNSGVWKQFPTTGDLTSGSANITGLPNGHGLLTGMNVYGTGINPGVNLLSVAANSAVMSSTATAGTGVPQTITGTVTIDGIHPDVPGHAAASTVIDLTKFTV